MTLKDVFDEVRQKEGREISQSEFAGKLGWSTATVSQLLNGKYPSNAEEKVKEARCILLGGASMDISPGSRWQPIEMKQDVIIATKSFNDTFNLCNSLLDSSTNISTSMGVVIGDAGRGKTTAVKRFVAEHESAVYILYMSYTKTQLFKAIAEALVGRSVGTYYGNLQLIMSATRIYRKLIIIDEADRIPLQILEDLRTLNEAGTVPVLLVGEPLLASVIKKADRIDSRIRKPRIEFMPLDYVTLATLYKEACGLEISKAVSEKLLKLSYKDFRVAVNDMQNIVRLMNINRYSELTEKVVSEYARS